MKRSSTWSERESTVGIQGATSDDDTVAPPYARLYVKISEALYLTVRKSAQFGPLAAVQPGYGGLPRGLPGAGCVRETLKPFVVYESPLTLLAWRDDMELISPTK
jgi:hypothetical protein